MARLEGKWVLFTSDWVGGVLGVQPYFVTSQSKNRIYVSKLLTEWDSAVQRYKFIDKVEPAGFKSVNSVKMVFETKEAASAAAECSQVEYDLWFRNQKFEMGRKILEEAKRLGGVYPNR